MGRLYQSSSKQGATGDSEDGLPGEEGEQELVHRGVRGGVGQDEGGGRVRDPLHPGQILWGRDVGPVVFVLGRMLQSQLDCKMKGAVLSKDSLAPADRPPKTML